MSSKYWKPGICYRCKKRPRRNKQYSCKECHLQLQKEARVKKIEAKSKANRTVQVDAGVFCGGLVIVNNRVVKAAPILGNMLGWQAENALSYCKFKGWKLTQVA